MSDYEHQLDARAQVLLDRKTYAGALLIVGGGLFVIGLFSDGAELIGGTLGLAAAVVGGIWLYSINRELNENTSILLDLRRDRRGAEPPAP